MFPNLFSDKLSANISPVRPTVNESSPITLTCSVTAANVKISWHYGGQEFTSGHNDSTACVTSTILPGNTTESSLTLKDPSENVTIMCRANQSFDEAFDNFNVLTAEDSTELIVFSSGSTPPPTTINPSGTYMYYTTTSIEVSTLLSIYMTLADCDIC